MSERERIREMERQGQVALDRDKWEEKARQQAERAKAAEARVASLEAGLERLVEAWRNLARLQHEPVPADAPMHAISYESLVFLDIAYEQCALLADEQGGEKS